MDMRIAYCGVMSIHKEWNVCEWVSCNFNFIIRGFTSYVHLMLQSYSRRCNIPSCPSPSTGFDDIKYS